ncbi:hypothetical protein [Galbibacter orientalis]|uniref:hypothetical protein n=1 Tax=Galbibacter orientalis TaxID=453852 RepID=UPI0030809E9D
MNIYIKAMQIGSDNLIEGITYPEMITKLEDEYKLNTLVSEVNFLRWFLDNFSDYNKSLSSSDAEDNLIKDYQFFYTNMNGEYLSELRLKYFSTLYPPSHMENHKEILVENSIKRFREQKYFLNGNTNKQYIDYLELSEARQSSKDSILYAKGALVIAIVTSVISICITLFKEEPKYPQPPYDVKLNEPINVKVNNPVQTYPLSKLDTTKIK